MRSGKNSSKEWHSEEEKTDSETDISNDAERGNGDDEVSPIGVGKVHRGVRNPQVSVIFFIRGGSLLGFKRTNSLSP